MTLTRKILWIVLVFLVLAGLPASFAADWTVRDANQNWTLRVSGEWYGGSYDQIQDRLAVLEQQKGAPPESVRILRTLGNMAKDIDAILLHIETSADNAHGNASFLKVKTMPTAGGKFPPITGLDVATWNALGKLFASNAGAEGAELVRHQEDIVIEGNQVAAAGFKIKSANRGERYIGVIVVYRPGRATMFNLDTPWQVSSARLDETWSMVRSVRFTDGKK